MTDLVIDRIVEDEEKIIFEVSHIKNSFYWGGRELIDVNQSFTRSNGTIIAQLYERLTKASRRRNAKYKELTMEAAYRRGVYDAFKALQEELDV